MNTELKAILIDAGHGLETPGKRSPDGALREGRYARQVAAAVVAGLSTLGYNASLVTPEDTDISLAERVRRVNEVCGRYGAEHVALVSVHVNASGDGRCWKNARGWSAYTSPGPTPADRLATLLYDTARHILPSAIRIREDRSDGDPDWEESFYILRRTRCPAVLTENLFMDNRRDMQYLLSTAGREAIVRLHVEGIARWAEERMQD